MILLSNKSKCTFLIIAFILITIQSSGQPICNKRIDIGYSDYGLNIIATDSNYYFTTLEYNFNQSSRKVNFVTTDTIGNVQSVNSFGGTTYRTESTNGELNSYYNNGFAISGRFYESINSKIKGF